jgi:hypothetical protein
MKSSGNDPSKLLRNFVRITTKLSGEMCFAASIRNPENPMEIKSVK